ncbi:MAG: PilT/PilU family type 4a pilus ATPase [Deltaproteobacteria bacterium]|nr:PilT/PilU family type 4a pilus ATPase [Deltaproteobacteria bacterium]
MDLDSLLKFMTKKGASDLHLKPTRPPLLRINGKIIPVDVEAFKPQEIEGMLMEILTPKQKERLDESMSVDLGYGVSGLARFRGNLYMQRGTLAASFRRIPYDVQNVEDLDLPDSLLDFTDIPMGLVLVTGPTGSGKSTTLAALIKHIANTKPYHVITIEDPVEFLFTDGISTISQREVGTDTTGFREALRNAMRQDPDVIMVGEMRDRDTIGTVITAAETGHLVFSTLHTNSAPQTLDRILDSFPADQQSQVRSQLAQVLKGVVSMKLVQRADGKGRVAALEILKASPKVCNLLEKGETTPIHEEIESSVGYYRMQTMNQSLLALLAHRTISYDEAMQQSPDPEDLSLKLRKMFPKIEEHGEDMATSDFSQILELQEFRRLYEEQEEKVKVRMGQKDEEIGLLQQRVADRNQRLDALQAQIQQLQEDQDRMRADYDRLRQESVEKIETLRERIRALNQRNTGATETSSGKKSGIFR